MKAIDFNHYQPGGFSVIITSYEKRKRFGFQFYK